MPRILAFAGSARRDSFNKKLVSAAAEMARELGAEVTVVDLADYPMPIYDGDEESENGHPEASNKLYQLMKEHDGFLVACPEYNSSITPLLKNTIDWVSRTRDAEPPLVAFTGKVVALLSASPGALGGMRGLVHVRSIFGNIGAFVIPRQATIPNASKTLSDEGISDDNLKGRVKDVVAQLVETASALAK
ncbi:MAG: FMN reductase [Planctomyces sp.]|nr:FMN reductase [Planctomyces sp.]